VNIELTKTDGGSLKMPRRTLTGDAKWRDIEDLINRWAKRSPRKAWELETYIKEIQADLYDPKHGKQRNEGMAGGRIGLALDQELLQYIQAFYPDFLQTKDEMHEFMKRFPKFRIPAKA
jgi:hypothetical protein